LNTSIYTSSNQKITRLVVNLFK